MRLIITSTYSHLRGPISADAYKALRDCLSYYRSGYQYTWLYKRGKWNGKDCLLYQDTDHVVFPAGLTHRVLPVLQEFGTVAVEQQLPGAFSAAVPTSLPDGIDLYPEQVKALESALTQQRGLFALATNFGKTECIAALAHALHPRRVLVLVDQRALLTQTVQRLEDRLRERIGRVLGPAVFTRERVVVGSIRTLCSRLEQPKVRDLLAHTSVLIVDEVHTVTPTWFPVLAACPAPFRIGVSGTVREGNQLVEEAFFGPLVMEVKESALVDLGRSAQTTILMPTCESWVPRTMDFRQVYDPGIVENGPRNQLIAEAAAWAAARGWPALILFYRHEHGARLYRAVQDKGIAAELVSGRTPLPAVERVKRDFLAGRIPVLVACVTGETEIRLLDGSVVPIQNLQGWHGWVYAFDIKNKHIVPGYARRVLRTGEQVPVLKVRIEGWNDQITEVRCTPEHRFLMLDYTYREAQALRPGDQLLPAEFRTSLGGYQGVFSPLTQRFHGAHRLIAHAAHGSPPGKNCVVHHKNFIPADNRPDNLQWLSKSAHTALHAELGFMKLWKNPIWHAWKAQQNRLQAQRRFASPEARAAVGRQLKAWWASLSAEGRASFLSRRRVWARTKAGKEFLAKQVVVLNQSAKKRERLRELHRTGRYANALPAMRKAAATPEARKKLSEALRGRAAPWNSDPAKIKKQRDAMLMWWARKNRAANHTVLSVVPDGTADVYDIEVADYHNFATTSAWLHNSTIFNKGIDLPNIRLLVNAAAWKSPLATRQKLGRVLRRKLEGQNTAVVLDPYDQVPTALAGQPDVGYTLQRHAERRAGTYRRQGFAVVTGTLQEVLAQAEGGDGSPMGLGDLASQLHGRPMASPMG